MLLIVLVYLLTLRCEARAQAVCTDDVLSCQNVLSNNLTYSCGGGNVKNRDFHLDKINEQVEEITLKDCEYLSLFLSPRTTIKTITIINCTSLRIQRSVERSATPTKKRTKFSIINSNISKLDESSLIGSFKSVQFNNVVIKSVETNSVQIVADEFVMINSRIENIHSSGLDVEAERIVLNYNDFGRVKGLRLKAKEVEVINNKFNETQTRSLKIRGTIVRMKNNIFKKLKNSTLSESGCQVDKEAITTFYFVNNTIENVYKYSFNVDFKSCDFASFTGNKIKCACRSVEWIFEDAFAELRKLLFNGGNTCHAAPCSLSVDVLNYMKNNKLCAFNLSEQVMCLLYEDKVKNLAKETNEDSNSSTDMTPAFYMIKKADNNLTSQTIFDKNAVNITNRTTIPMAFEPCNDFVEALRNTRVQKSVNNKGRLTTEIPKATTDSEENRKLILDFYKKLYTELRDKKKN